MAENKTIKNPITTCDECEKQFKLKPARILKEKVVEGIERSYFVCPYCKHKFVIVYEDQEFKNNIEKMSNLQKRMSEITLGSDASNELIKSHKVLHERNIEISQSYKRIYGR